MVETAPPGSAVGRLRAHDPDEGENALLAYSILDGGDGAEAFAIHTDALGQDGIITVRKVGGGVPVLGEPWALGSPILLSPLPPGIPCSPHGQ